RRGPGGRAAVADLSVGVQPPAVRGAVTQGAAVRAAGGDGVEPHGGEDRTGDRGVAWGHATPELILRVATPTVGGAVGGERAGVQRAGGHAAEPRPTRRGAGERFDEGSGAGADLPRGVVAPAVDVRVVGGGAGVDAARDDRREQYRGNDYGTGVAAALGGGGDLRGAGI